MGEYKEWWFYIVIYDILCKVVTWRWKSCHSPKAMWRSLFPWTLCLISYRISSNFLVPLAPSKDESCHTTLYQHYVQTFLNSAISRICNKSNNTWNTFLYYFITIMSFNMWRFIEFITSFSLNICIHFTCFLHWQ